MPLYECDKCGACSEHLIVEADEVDVLREPRLLQADPHYAHLSVDAVVARFQEDFGLGILIACGPARPCPFLGRDKHCTIYPTRPNDCVAMLAGDEQCQAARQAAGLPPLLPKDNHTI